MIAVKLPVEKRVSDLTLAEKIGHMTQFENGTVSAAKLDCVFGKRSYGFVSTDLGSKDATTNLIRFKVPNEDLFQ